MLMSEPSAGSGRRWWARSWIATTYFGEGFPYSIVRYLSTIYFKESGASLQAIGMTSLFGLPWVFKFLWAPFVDEFSVKRRWILFMEICLFSIIALMALTSTLPGVLPFMTVLFLVTAILSATHDIAIDGFYLEALDKKEQARYVGFQAMSYRLAMITVDGGILFVYGKTGWWEAFLLAAIILGGLFAFHAWRLPRIETARRPASALIALITQRRNWLFLLAAALLTGIVWQLQAIGAFAGPAATMAPLFDRLGVPGLITILLLLVLIALALNIRRLKAKLYGSNSFYALAFVDYLDQPRIGVILAFLVFYRTGESFLLNMRYPFFRDIGITPDEFALACGTFGIVASIAGGLLGGGLISRFGLRRVIWPMVLSQNILNLFYMFLAYHYEGILEIRTRLMTHLGQNLAHIWQDMLVNPGQFAQIASGLELHRADFSLVTLLVILEALGAGLGTAVFMVFIMRTCKPRYKAANMSIATGIMNVSATMAGVFSGFLASWLGFPLFFGFTFLATLPGMSLILFLPYLDGTSAVDHASPSSTNDQNTDK
jgi:PAT family beta-lactamase induction signal transducer AmpG